MSKIDIVGLTEVARYSEVLSDVASALGGKKVLRLDYESDYQGYVDIDVLLSDGRVFSYMYSYGSCSGCDEWEARDLSDEQIGEAMLQEATFFASIGAYNDWRKKVNDES